MKPIIGKKIDLKESNTEKNPIDFRILLLIAGLTVVDYFFRDSGYLKGYEFFEPYHFVVLIAGIVAITVGIKFWNHNVFRTSYIALGISFFMLLIGNTTYL